jgi:hypothetical protein
LHLQGTGPYIDDRSYALKQAFVQRTDGKARRNEKVGPLSTVPVIASTHRRTCRARERFAWGQSDILLNLRAYNAAVSNGGYSAMRSFCEENFVNFNTIRDITSLRQDFQAALSEIGLIDPPGRGPRRDEVMEEWNINSENENLLKAILVGAFWPRIVRIRLPDAKFEKVQAGSVAKEHEAREVKYYDSVDNTRVFIVSGPDITATGTSVDSISLNTASWINLVSREQPQARLRHILPPRRDKHGVPL